MNRILTPKESNVYIKSRRLLQSMTPKESNVYSKSHRYLLQSLNPKESNVYSKSRRLLQSMTPKESNVYSKLIFHPSYDSFGVEQEDVRFFSINMQPLRNSVLSINKQSFRDFVQNLTIYL
jgi:hypothetical protein